MRSRIRMGARAAAWLAAAASLAIAPAALADAGAGSAAVCPPAPAGFAHCMSQVIVTAGGVPQADASPLAVPRGYGPAQFHGAYNLPTTTARSASQTIAIVDAYNSPSAEADLGRYSQTFGLPACTTANRCFKKVNQRGQQGNYPTTDSGWALEIALDVQTAHAICQNCKILLVEASSASFGDLEAAVNTAARLGATVISNSYGSSNEFPGETSNAYNHPGIAVTASSGDNGFGTAYPAADPHVVAVGGTRLTVGAGNSYGGERVWNGAGSGCSLFENARTWQQNASGWNATLCRGARGIADVSADADPQTGAAIYDSTPYQGQRGWFVVGGTSLSSPLIASVFALAGNASSTRYPSKLLYQHASGLHDVTAGSNGTCGTTMCKGAPGYDGPSGLGTPNGLSAF